MTTGNVDTFDSGLLKLLFSALTRGRDTTKIKSYYQYLTPFRFRHGESDKNMQRQFFSGPVPPSASEEGGPRTCEWWG